MDEATKALEVGPNSVELREIRVKGYEGAGDLEGLVGDLRFVLRYVTACKTLINGRPLPSVDSHIYSHLYRHTASFSLSSTTFSSTTRKRHQPIFDSVSGSTRNPRRANSSIASFDRQKRS